MFYFLSVLLINVVVGEDFFKSVPVTVKSYENDSVMLPCYIDDSEPQTRVRWYKDERLLGDSRDPRLLLPPRVVMLANYSLHLERLSTDDTANYTCEVLRPEPWAPMKQTHFIEVQFTPKVRTIPDDGFVEVRKGEYVDIGCEVSGTPDPVVEWKKNGEVLALLEHRSRIRFRAEHRLLAGVYECVVNNGIGDPVTGAIKVVIQDAPVVTASTSTVHSAVGLRASLCARLQFSWPPAAAAWYRAGGRVRTDHRIVEMVENNEYQLIFRSVRESDFGNYTFRAENRFGMADVTFRLTGVPNAASFKVEQTLNKASATTFTLIWEVDSYSTILEYNLWLRPYMHRLQDSSSETVHRWSKIVVPGDSAQGPIHSAQYTVRGLTPSTVYEAIVTSRNKHGWSQQSAILHFATEPLGGHSIPSTSDYSDVTPLLEEPSLAHNITQAQIYKIFADSKAREIKVSAILIIITGILAGL